MDSQYISSQNRDVEVARPGELAPLELGPLKISPPVVLAPMAGITNFPYRALCRRFGAGLCVSEMITARALVEGNEKTLSLAGFNPAEQPRSLQLYGTDPEYVGRAVAFLVGEDRVDHIDMNFGCPVRKVTRKGGGAAIPLKPRLLTAIVRAAIREAGAIPVTLKFRIGINESLETYLDAGRIAEAEGCAAVALHARTAAQLYDGDARWETIARLKETVRSIPVLGNGDIWEGFDALRMMRSTGCDGVVVGRGCLGRPWLFRDLRDVMTGHEPTNPPHFGEIREIMQEHARLLVEWFGEHRGIRSFRKQATWYTKGFPGGTHLRRQLVHLTHLHELEAILEEADPDLPFPPDAMRVPRGKTSGTQRVALPEGYLDHLDDASPPDPSAEDVTDGG